jgi:hypothetical protein
MKRILILLAVIIVHCTLLIDNCQSQWVQQSVPVTAGYFNDMKFVNANTGFILVWANPLATFMRTTNAGYNWQTLNNWGMAKVAIVDTSCIYASGYNNGKGVIYKSSNLGVTWDSINSSGVYYYNNLHFFNKDTGLISSGDTYDNQIWRTTNGGQSLQLIQSFGGASSGTFFFLKEKINGEYYGWLYYPRENSYISLTTNSGLNWVSRPSIPENVKSVFFINKDTGWASAYYDRNYVFRTTDGGNIWLNYTMPYTSSNFDILFVTPQKGWIGCDLSNKIYATTNGGIVWGTQYILGLGSSKLSFIDSMTGWAQSSWNAISLTTNGGGTITSIISGSTETQKDYRLYQNYPNPFNPITNVKFSILNAGDVKIVVYDVQGREVQTLVNETLKPGTYETTFDGSTLPTGIYFYQLFADGIGVQTRKMILLK